MRYDFTASTGYWITLTAHHYQHRVDQELRPFGITFRQFQVIGWLKVEGPMTQSELARRMLVEPPTLAGILSRMESMSWIQRTCCQQDRRKKYVDVGNAAEPVWERIVEILNKVRQEASRNLEEEEVHQLHTLLHRVLRNLGGIPIPRPTLEPASIQS